MQPKLLDGERMVASLEACDDASQSSFRVRPAFDVSVEPGQGELHLLASPGCLPSSMLRLQVRHTISIVGGQESFELLDRGREPVAAIGLKVLCQLLAKRAK